MRQFIIAGNWKLNAPEIKDYVSKLSAAPDGVRIVIFPPFTYISEMDRHTAVIERQNKVKIEVGAQDVSERDSGAYTGEVSAAMLRATGAGYALIGHSERRRYHGETDGAVRRKVKRALDSCLHPIICVGETEAERAGGETLRVISAQITAALDGLSPDEISLVAAAYEPVWAIGTGVSASPIDAQDACRAVRGAIGARFGAVSAELSILYGGSMSSSNAAELLAQPDIDGGLIGSASLDAAEFCEIIKIAAELAAAEKS
ncbi:MAG: triose-phosphate isomerase [Oscillospiraceae bacterium]|jgi:triosephosphate isomerase|nr:triose-phosphate isomerase [Oscillospiraceae bacterium]